MYLAFLLIPGLQCPHRGPGMEPALSGKSAWESLSLAFCPTCPTCVVCVYARASVRVRAFALPKINQ